MNFDEPTRHENLSLRFSDYESGLINYLYMKFKLLNFQYGIIFLYNVLSTNAHLVKMVTMFPNSPIDIKECYKGLLTYIKYYFMVCYYFCTDKQRSFADELINEIGIIVETGYIYFSLTEDLDDPLECSISISNKIVDGNQKENLKDLIPFILKQLFTNGSNKKYKCIDFTDMYDDEGNLLKDKFKLYVEYVDSNLKNDAIEKAMQSIKEVSTFIDKNPQFEDAFMKLLNIKKLVGVCSLTELSNNQVIWSEYARWLHRFLH